MKRPKTIDVQISQHDLGVIIKAFESIDHNYTNTAVFDNQMLQLSRQDLRDITAKLKSHQAENQDPAVLTMNFSDWVSYTSCLLVIDGDLPGMQHEELVMIENLNDRYYEMDEREQTPAGP